MICISEISKSYHMNSDIYLPRTHVEEKTHKFHIKKYLHLGSSAMGIIIPAA